MEILHAESRYINGSSSQYSSASMDKKVGLSNFYDVQQSKLEAPIVFKTRNLTKSLAKIDEKSSNIITFKDHNSKSPCLLFSHGLKPNRGSSNSLKPDRFEDTLNLLPLTTCTKHGNSSFLPLDHVRKLPEYTRTTHKFPVFKVIHSFEHCVLQFPHPPPIASSEEHLFQLNDYMNKCYQCFTNLSFQTPVFMYRDYLFCCQTCRLTACATHYWYKKAMKAENDEEKRENDGLEISTMEGAAIFTIES